MKLRERLQHFFDPPVVAKLWRLLAQAKALGLYEADYVNARESLEANEWELSFDTIVTQLCEYEIPVTSEFIGLSEEIIDSMKIDQSKYRFLYTLPIRDSQE